MDLNNDIDEVERTTYCPRCEEPVHICDGCLEIIHHYETLVTSSSGQFCRRCWNNKTGRCTRRKL